MPALSTPGTDVHSVTSMSFCFLSAGERIKVLKIRRNVEEGQASYKYTEIFLVNFLRILPETAQ